MTIGATAPDHLFARRDWRAAAIALLFTALIVFAGEAFGKAITEALRHVLPDASAVFGQVSGPAVVAAYQIALLWFLAGWWFGAERRPALGLSDAPLAWWIWPAAILGLYALKALISIAVLYVVHDVLGNGSIVPPTGSGPIPAPAPSGDLSPFGALMRSPAWPLMLVGGILAGIVEELLYRGYLSRTLEGTRLGFLGGATLASLIWAALHLYYPLPMQVVLVVMGLALSWLRRRTGSILPGMAWHIANNVIALLALRLIGS